MRNQKGITLVALVVTIVVLLILAGTSIAMLSGDSGIITNAQKSTAANTEGQVTENIKNAYNTIKTEIVTKASTDNTYNALDDEDSYAVAQEIANTVAREITGKSSASYTENVCTDGGYTITYTAPTSTTTPATISIVYTDASFAEGKTVAGVECNTIQALFTIGSSDVSLSWDTDKTDPGDVKGPFFIPSR